jgi:hypothetical protein
MSWPSTAARSFLNAHIEFLYPLPRRYPDRALGVPEDLTSGRSISDVIV